ncbi:hypothetical protein D030_0381A, partial [Vibrio parahaemolyticus AQ3810]
MIMP